MRTLRVVLILFLLSTISHAAIPGITITEADIRASVTDKDITVAIPIVSTLPGSPAAILKAELLDTNDHVVASASVDHPLNRGRNVRSLVLAKPALIKFAEDRSACLAGLSKPEWRASVFL